MTIPVYQTENLVHHYNGRPVLQLDALSVEKAAILGLAGPNGSGKSTLLKLLAFVDRPSKGQVRFKGKPEVHFSDGVRFQITLLTQEPYLLKRSVLDNVAYGLRIRNGRKDFRPQAADALSMVGLDPDTFMHRKWNELSGGEAQRVALAARLALRPEVLLLDEPTASVDGASAQMIREAALNARQEWGTTLVVASHDREWLHAVCDEVVHLFRGRPLGSSAVNIIYGPWEKGTDGVWGKRLSDGQRLVVPEPPSADAVLTIPPGAITLGSGSVSQNDPRCLRGTIAGLRLKTKTKTPRLIATTRFSGINLSVQIDPGQAEKQGIYPGRPVAARLSTADMAWVGERKG
jgi:tungstate transport system ATP-binding protein